ncbi:hypothetical protein BH18THE1_BH18THE1_15230 [soil metagenome]
MIGRIIALIVISSILFAVTSMHGHTYGSLIVKSNNANNNHPQQYYAIASLINNQTTNKEIMIELKTQIEKFDPFELRDINNEKEVLKTSSVEGTHSNNLDINDLDSNVNSNSDYMNDIPDDYCKSDCPGNLNPTRDDIPFELPNIPFP